MRYISFLCNIIFPGFGSALVGKLRLAVSLCLGFLFVLWLGCQFNLPDTTSDIWLLLTLLISYQVTTACLTFRYCDISLLQTKQSIITVIVKALLLLSLTAGLLFGLIKQMDAIFGYAIYYVPSQSMQPTLEPGDLILVNTQNLTERTWSKGDIVVFYDKHNSDFYYVKRIGDKPSHLQNTDDDLYFMRGDNVENSADSRVFGMVHQRQILGLAKVVVLNVQQPERSIVDIK